MGVCWSASSGITCRTSASASYAAEVATEEIGCEVTATNMTLTTGSRSVTSIKIGCYMFSTIYTQNAFLHSVQKTLY
jgi:hypothetical protein